MRLGEFAATLALAQDNAFGQPLESQFRSCLLATWFSHEAGFDSGLCHDVYWVALLRYLGCTGHAHEVATLFGDEIAIRAQTLVHDAANPEEVIRDVITFATAGRGPEESGQIIKMIHEGAHAWAVHNFASGCEVTDMLLNRIDFGAGVREALRFTFERWNGNGFPTHAKGEAIPLAMRLVHLTHDMEAICRLKSPEAALQAAADRRGRTYDPALVDIFLKHGADWFHKLKHAEPWSAVLALEPEPRRVLEGDELDNALLIAADFIDMKSPYMAGHSRRCADLCREAARELKLPEDEVAAIWRAALIHDFGTTAISNSIWDKPSSLTRAERDRVELHTMLTEQMLRRSAALEALNRFAASHHETANGRGYHKRLAAETFDANAGILAAADIYIGLTADRADRARFSDADAATEIRRLAAEGALDKRTANAVLVAAGHVEPRARRASNPGGLSEREIEVLRLAARGLSTKDIADKLYISPKTADHHIQHVYTKIGVSTRAAAALWAMQNSVVR
ncbi:MAG TPA: HD domain-containing phosphohydrolase [Terriglobia bacterium]|nr:HD domain-containing phosphohydrolase [Terriglobia bacterium]